MNHSNDLHKICCNLWRYLYWSVSSQRIIMYHTKRIESLVLLPSSIQSNFINKSLIFFWLYLNCQRNLRTPWESSGDWGLLWWMLKYFFSLSLEIIWKSLEHGFIKWLTHRNWFRTLFEKFLKTLNILSIQSPRHCSSSPAHELRQNVKTENGHWKRLCFRNKCRFLEIFWNFK